MHCLNEDQLSLVLGGQVSARDNAIWTGHIDVCSQCQRNLEQLAGGVDWLPAICDAETGQLAAFNCSDPNTTTCSDRKDTADHDLSNLQTLDGHDDSLSGFLRPSDRRGFSARFGRFHVVNVVGQGGMGIVLKALDPTLERIVAVKVLAPQLAASARARQRFLREARAAARVVNDHVVAIHAVDQFDGLPYLVMQFIEGQSLDEQLQSSGPLEISEVVRVAVQTAIALRSAHQADLVHRDIKPANILLDTTTGRYKITDFGLARAGEDEALTRTGFIAGTPHQMAPEQARGEPVDHRADLYSLGAVLFTACTGHPPFRGETLLSVLNKVINDDPPNIRSLNPKVPEWLEKIVKRLMAKDPSCRFQSADEVLHALSSRPRELAEPGSTPTPQCDDADPNRQRKLSRRDRVALAAIAIIGPLFCLTCITAFSNNLFPKPPAHPHNEARIADDARAIIPPTTTSACLIQHPDDTLSLADDLSDAIRLAKDGSIIELRGQEPFRIDHPVDTLGKKLVIRAAKDSTPIVRIGPIDSTTTVPALTASGPLVLEGIEFQYEHDSQRSNRRGSVILAHRHPIRITNCRLEMMRPAPVGYLSWISLGQSSAIIQNSLLVCDSKGAAIVVESDSSTEVHIENCILLANNALSICRPLNNHEAGSGAVELQSNTVVAKCGVHLLSPPGVHHQNDFITTLYARSNLFEVRYLCTTTLAAALGPAEAELTALDRLSRNLVWSGCGNLYSTVQAYCGFSIRMRPYVAARSGPRSLASWQDFCCEEDDSSCAGDVTFDDTTSRLRGPTDTRIVPTDYCFSIESPNQQVVRNRRVGANADFVGPGKGYRAWQRSPAGSKRHSTEGRAAE